MELYINGLHAELLMRVDHEAKLNEQRFEMLNKKMNRILEMSGADESDRRDIVVSPFSAPEPIVAVVDQGKSDDSKKKITPPAAKEVENRGSKQPVVVVDEAKPGSSKQQAASSSSGDCSAPKSKRDNRTGPSIEKLLPRKRAYPFDDRPIKRRERTDDKITRCPFCELFNCEDSTACGLNIPFERRIQIYRDQELCPDRTCVKYHNPPCRKLFKTFCTFCNGPHHVVWCEDAAYASQNYR